MTHIHSMLVHPVSRARGGEAETVMKTCAIGSVLTATDHRSPRCDAEVQTQPILHRAAAYGLCTFSLRLGIEFAVAVYITA